MTDTTSSSTAPAVAHGTIRLRGRDPQAARVDTAPTAAAPAAAHGPVGHGTIRLRQPNEPAPAAAAAAPAAAVVGAAPDPVGHGSIRLYDRALRIAPDATLAAEADILQTLGAAS